MIRLSKYLLVFSIVFFVLLVAPAFLGGELQIYPLMSWGDALDIFTPLILLPLYWILFWYACVETVKLGESLVFVVLAALWAEGQGMHLSANSIGHLLDKAAFGNAYLLTYFYDEDLSHYLWHLGIFGLAVLLIYLDWRSSESSQKISWGLIIPAGIIHGLTIFLIVIEAGTLPLGFAFLILVTLIVSIWGRDQLKQKPLVSFFFTSCIIALFLIAGWGLYFGGFPEFSEVGLL